MSYMGVDIGTTGSKVTVINENGEIIYHDAMGYPLHLSEGVRAELFPGEMWSAFQTLVSRAGQTCEKKDPIRSLALSLLGEAVMPVDDRGVPLDNTLVSMDYRGGKQAQEIAEKVEPRMIYDQTGQHCHPMYSASKILWWKEITPEIFSRTWKFLCWEDFLSLKLCGKPFIDHSLATRTMFFDIQEKKWSVDILTSLDLSPDLFSEVIPSGIPIGPVLPKMVEELHLPPDIILVSGAWDQACATLGAGLHSSDVFLDSFGTTMCLGVCVDRPVLNQGLFHSGYQTTCFIFPGSYFVNGGSMNGGVLLKWYRDQLKEELRDKLVHERKDFFETTMETLDYTPSPLYMMPYFAGKGTPELDSTRQGIIFGLTCESSSRDILKALLESLCFETRRNLDFLEKNLSVNFGEVRVVGGGSRSHYFSRLKSTIYGKKIVFFDFPDLSAFGAAVLAMAGVEGWGKALGVLDHFQEKARIFEYSSENKSIYEQKYHHYLALGQTLDRCLMDYSFLISKETF